MARPNPKWLSRDTPSEIEAEALPTFEQAVVAMGARWVWEHLTFYARSLAIEVRQHPDWPRYIGAAWERPNGHELRDRAISDERRLAIVLEAVDQSGLGEIVRLGVRCNVRSRLQLQNNRVAMARRRDHRDR